MNLTGIPSVNPFACCENYGIPNYRNNAMNMDFYELTMANAYFMAGLKDKVYVFDMFFRKNPAPQGEIAGYSVSCGQEQLTKFLLNYYFDDDACNWMLAKGFDSKFVKYLSQYKWNGTMYAMPEGTIAYPNEQMVRIKCDAIGALLIETYLLQTMNFNSLIATKASRIVSASHGRAVLEFGGRRAQSETASLYGARAAIIGGCTGTANCEAEIVFGPNVKASGTMSHAWVESFHDEFEAFKVWADVYPTSVSLLIDTYNIFTSGVVNTIKVDNYLIDKYPDDLSRRVKSIRIDSGDLGSGAKRLRKILDEAGKSYIKIVASNSLNEKSIRSLLEEQKAPIDIFGVGENLITSSDCPVFGGVYKLVAVEETDENGNIIYEPKMKCSDTKEKAIIPGYKTVYRIYNEDGYGYLDLIAMVDEKIVPGKPIKVYSTDITDTHGEYIITPTVIKELLVPFIVDGKPACELPTISQIRDFVNTQLETTVWPEELRTQYPHRHFVDMTEKVYKVRNEMYKKLHG